MATHASTDHATLFFQHFSVLRNYAERMFLDGEALDSDEVDDHRDRMEEFMYVGSCCNFTEQQLVSLLLAELLDD